jgi:predicted O-methyltransferase YrrM
MFYQFFSFLKYYWRAQTKYDIHSPLVFEFTENVLEDDRRYYAFSQIETWRERLKSDFTKIELTDFGAGSNVHASKQRTLSSLARHSANNPYTCRLLFRIVNHFKPGILLELGTSLGISAAFQARALQNGRLITLEGCPKVAHYARETFRHTETTGVDLRQGHFEEVLPEVLREIGRIDYLFIDGNHRREPTVNYFLQCLERSHPESIFVFGDIHWSRDMELAWNEIKSHPSVTLTIDLYYIGVVFFRKNQAAKRDYTLCPWIWKPWRIGLGDFFKP